MYEKSLTPNAVQWLHLMQNAPPPEAIESVWKYRIEIQEIVLMFQHHIFGIFPCCTLMFYGIVYNVPTCIYSTELSYLLHQAVFQIISLHGKGLCFCKYVSSVSQWNYIPGHTESTSYKVKKIVVISSLRKCFQYSKLLANRSFSLCIAPSSSEQSGEWHLYRLSLFLQIAT